VVSNPSTPPLLEVRNLAVCFAGSAEPVRVVRDLSLEIARGEVLALVGETGSGKSTVALAVAGLLDSRTADQSGEISFEGQRLSGPGGIGWNSVRGHRIGFVFQDPRSSLNPVLTVGTHLVETLRAHTALSARQAKSRAADLLEEVGMADARFQMKRYPFELSGGMCQRVAVALALCGAPSLLIADEPTSALDPTIQAQILHLLEQMRVRRGLALLLISHDLALVSESADRVAVMYHGRLVEYGGVREVLADAAHPYTEALLRCTPALGHHPETDRLDSIPGSPPPAGQDLPGCVFAPRCARAEERCAAERPIPVHVSGGHWAACLKAGN
jgi:oligopeptide/dipeptide ABC transporter ATP-binding protein